MASVTPASAAADALPVASAGEGLAALQPNAYHILIVEPFYGGSHAQFIQWLVPVLEAGRSSASRADGLDALPVKVHVFTLPDKKWHWKMRLSGLWAADAIPPVVPGVHGTLLTTSMMNLTELLAFRPDLLSFRRVMYFHENQLTYPVRPKKALVPSRLTSGSEGHEAPTLATGIHIASEDVEYPASADRPMAAPPAKRTRQDGPSAAGTKLDVSSQEGRLDFHFGWIQISSALLAHSCLFNSAYNMSSFLGAIDKHMRTCPDKTLRGPARVATLREKSRVLPFPVPGPPVFLDRAPSSITTVEPSAGGEQPLLVLWNHRWEYDKNPEDFFDAVEFMIKKRLAFQLVLLGQSFEEQPEVFRQIDVLRARGFVAHAGYLPDKASYWQWLQRCDVVISTAVHEFYGVSVVEAILGGCYPLLPNRLAYPEIVAGVAEGVPGWKKGFLYATLKDLKQMLYALATTPSRVRTWRTSPGAEALRHKLETCRFERDYLAALLP